MVAVAVGLGVVLGAARSQADTTVVRLRISEVLQCEQQVATRASGRPQAGAVQHSMRLPKHPALRVKSPERDRQWGTAELVAVVVQAANRYRARYRTGAPVLVGDMSRRGGGPVSGHVSHENGRDVDLGLFFRDGRARFRRARPAELDADRTWALMQALLETGWVELLLVDRRLHQPLREAARRAGAHPERVRHWFAHTIRHWPKHDDHLHVRIKDRRAVCGHAVAGR